MYYFTSIFQKMQLYRRLTKSITADNMFPISNERGIRYKMKPAEKQTTEKKKGIVLFILIILTLIVIWGHSCFNKATSTDESSFVLDLLKPFLDIFVGKGKTDDHLVRKLAHFVEYAVLGFELSLFFIRQNIFKSLVNILSKIMPRILITLNLGFIIAFIDETIQIFSKRGPAILDVWIDFFGLLTSVILVNLLASVVSSKRN